MPKNYRVIVLRGQPYINEEGVAATADILPGMLVKGVSSIAKHSTSGGAAARAFVLERDEAGRDVDTVYAINDKVKVGLFQPGERVWAIIPSGQNIAEDGWLMSNGDGTLIAHTGSNTRIGRCLEAVNNSAGPSYARVVCEVY
jgi:hypothetical protein